MCCNGALILDEERRVLYSKGFRAGEAAEIAERIARKFPDCCLNLYTTDR